MRSPYSRLSGLDPIMIPELGFPPLSPSDPGFSSPADSDTIYTPFLEGLDHLQLEFSSPSPDRGNDRTRQKQESRRQGGKENVASQFLEQESQPRHPQLFSKHSPPLQFEESCERLTLSPILHSLEYPSSPEIQLRDNGFYSGLNSEPLPIKIPHSPPLLRAGSDRPFQSTLLLRAQGDIRRESLNLEARRHSLQFPVDHKLNQYFARKYHLQDHLGSGGYGFVMTARNRKDGNEVAVKFIIKEKVPEHAWTEDEAIGRLPTEVMLLSFLEHENIVKCFDLFEDNLYFYLVQELHGSPWPRADSAESVRSSHGPSASLSIDLPTPMLSPSGSEISIPGTEPYTPPHSPQAAVTLHPAALPDLGYLPNKPPAYSRRPSHDLFECIEQSEHRRLSEPQARYVFSQVVDAVHYMNGLGVTHRDIKDENLVIGKDLKVKLIDFGSAIVVDINQPSPFYTLFYGTSAYASSEILLKQPYQAPPAEIWTLGVLLSFLLTGTSPFPTVKDAIDGNIVLSAGTPGARVSRIAFDLLKKCLDTNPGTRATIEDIINHPWLNSDRR